jgi:hypothetical protein
MRERFMAGARRVSEKRTHKKRERKKQEKEMAM